MSKELEKSIKWLSNVNNFENVSRYSKEYFEHFNKVVKALTPPTKEELCDLLSKKLKSTIVTKKNKHGVTFNYAETGKTIISRNYENLDIKAQLTPELFEMIGRFYEGVRK